MLKGKNVILGVTGGIATYKSLELVRLLVKDSARVKVIMTKGGQQFITPLSFETISGNSVFTDTFDSSRGLPLAHIELANEADILVITPATANIIGKIANGIADDLLTTVVMATKAPCLIAPAMNVNMYCNPIVQSNIERLKGFGYHFIGPEEGELACGYEGRGRMSEPDKIKEAIIRILTPKDLEGKKILVTAGPTREFIDPVRFMSNPSTGKQGYLLARVAKRRGADVCLISGPTFLKPPEDVEFVRVTTSLEMREEVLKRFDDAHCVIMAAAVSDFSLKEVAEEKIKKDREGLILRLNPTPDILKGLGEIKRDKILIGFAAETENIVENARRKLIEKRLDFIVANDVKDKASGFEKDTNRVIIIDRERVDELPLLSKEEVAERVLDRVSVLL